jgi:energy-coupling factor transporter ATP-binding protein EcfA2
MLEFDNVSKSFWTGTQHKVILEKVSFRVELGRSLGILAPNGTGKTTVINMMAGLEKPDEGVIRRGCRISFPLGFMGGVVSRLSARENARYIAQLYGIDPDYVEAYCRWLCGLGEYFDQPLGTYSSGMRARFSFRHISHRRGDARLDRCGIQPQGRRDIARAAAHHHNRHRVPRSQGAREIRQFRRRSDGWQTLHVRHLGRGKSTL